MPLVKELIIVHHETGEAENCGVIANTREVGRYRAWLVFQQAEDVNGRETEDGLWWIIFKPRDASGPIKKLGYSIARRELCWEDFFRIDEEHILDEMNRVDDQPS
ncbi:MAG: hypothetical protein ACREJC_05530 [Tepidisphaeraceae bacterium]